VAAERIPNTNDPDKDAPLADPDAPGTYTDDEETPAVPEPNEPA